MQVLEAALVVVLAIALLWAHIAFCSRIWRENRPLIGVLKIAGESVLMYIAWYIVAVVAAILLGFFSPGTRGVEVDAYYSTLGALIYPCDAIPGLRAVTGDMVCDLPGYAIGVPVLFVVGLVGAIVVNYIRRQFSSTQN
jgi:hypothetical protein